MWEEEERRKGGEEGAEVVGGGRENAFSRSPTTRPQPKERRIVVGCKEKVWSSSRYCYRGRGRQTGQASRTGQQKRKRRESGMQSGRIGMRGGLPKKSFPISPFFLIRYKQEEGVRPSKRINSSEEPGLHVFLRFGNETSSLFLLRFRVWTIRQGGVWTVSGQATEKGVIRIWYRTEEEKKRGLLSRGHAPSSPPLSSFSVRK